MHGRKGRPGTLRHAAAGASTGVIGAVVWMAYAVIGGCTAARLRSWTATTRPGRPPPRGIRPARGPACAKRTSRRGHAVQCANGDRHGCARRGVCCNSEGMTRRCRADARCGRAASRSAAARPSRSDCGALSARIGRPAARHMRTPITSKSSSKSGLESPTRSTCGATADATMRRHSGTSTRTSRAAPRQSREVLPASRCAM